MIKTKEKVVVYFKNNYKAKDVFFLDNPITENHLYSHRHKVILNDEIIDANCYFFGDRYLNVFIENIKKIEPKKELHLDKTEFLYYTLTTEKENDIYIHDFLADMFLEEGMECVTIDNILEKSNHIPYNCIINEDEIRENEESEVFETKNLDKYKIVWC